MPMLPRPYTKPARAGEGTPSQRKQKMSMLKVIEVLAESEKSWEDAAQLAVTKAGKTVHNVKSIYIENFEATVDQGKLKKYRVNAKISFLLD
jgi:flavin-binding protein dodecin